MVNQKIRWLAWYLPALILLSSMPLSWARDCVSSPSNKTETSKALVARVSDGDTIVLDSNRKVRLIGFNTLEIDSRQPDEKYWAQRAKDALESLVLNQRVLLTAGYDATDRYRRILAHVQLEDGRDIAQMLIQQGLAFSVTVGRNSRCSRNNARLESEARHANLGLWSSPHQWIDHSDTLGTTSRGFQIMRTRVDNIRGTGKKLKIHLSNGLHASLGKHWPLSDTDTREFFSELRDRPIEIRGWVGKSGARSVMTIHHPANVHAIGN